MALPPKKFFLLFSTDCIVAVNRHYLLAFYVHRKKAASERVALLRTVLAFAVDKLGYYSILMFSYEVRSFQSLLW